MKEYDKLIFELSDKGKKGYCLPECDVPLNNLQDIIPDNLLSKEQLELPEVSEPDIVRHYTHLAHKNYNVDCNFYPLGSCTMKYNPKINEDMANLSGFTKVHPYQPENTVQGCLKVMYQLCCMLAEITGMDKVSLQPAAGAHGELTGLMIIKSYHHDRGDYDRNKIIVPDSAHGTNPASVSLAGFETVQVKSAPDGTVDLDHLKRVLDQQVAGLMLTNPNTLGIFEYNIDKIARLVHQAGGLLYCDGANMNAIMGIARPGDMGFDIMHLNLHKTFSAPHGGGGPGSGPIAVKKHLSDFLPVPDIELKEGVYRLNYDRPKSIGKVKSFYGNFGVIVKAYAYILSMGAKGLKYASEMAVLNANYLMSKLKNHYNLAVEHTCMHEFVLSGLRDAAEGVNTMDVAKRLIDYGFHPPTVYFPLIVKEALMIEPTETEAKCILDDFAHAMVQIAQEAKTDKQLVKHAPYSAPVGRLDEVTAARKPVLRYTKK